MNNNGKSILIVDDDPSVLDSMAGYFADESGGLRVLKAGSGQEAIEILSTENISLVVTDIFMPGVSGIDLLSEIRACYPQVEVILMTGFGTDQIREEAREQGCLHFLEKPVQFATLKKLVEKQLLAGEEGFVGTLKSIQLIDLIQMCCLSDMQVAVRVLKDGHEGTIYLQGGDVIHAACEDCEGEDAFYRILSWRCGRFETLSSVSAWRQTIHKPVNYLLMEAARYLDELNDSEGPDAACDLSVDSDTAVEKLRLLVVDDSALMVRGISEILESDGTISVVGSASNGEEALTRIEELRPDLITLDVNMPVMDGGTALKHIMIKNPCPVVIVSNLAKSSQERVLDFLRIGAVDFIHKPAKVDDLEGQKQQMIQSVHRAAAAGIRRFKRVKSPARVDPALKMQSISDRVCDRLVAVVSGPGGYAELIKIVPRLPRNLASGIVVLQSMSEAFAGVFAAYLDARSQLPVIPLEPPIPITTGCCFIGPNETKTPRVVDDKKNVRVDDATDSSAVGNTGSFFLKTAAEQFDDRLMTVLLSGADISDGSSDSDAGLMAGRIVVQKPDSAMLSQSLENVLLSQPEAEEMNPGEIVEQIIAFSQ